MMKAYVYMLECADGTLYTGWTNDLNKRIVSHNAGTGAKYTRTRLPVKMIWHEECEDKSVALKREVEIKKMPRKKKQELAKM